MLCISITIPFGFAFGLLTLIISLFGGNVYSNLLVYQLHGIIAGLANLIVGPVTLALIGLVFGLVAYIPFKFYLKIRKGVIIEGQWEEKK